MLFSHQSLLILLYILPTFIASVSNAELECYDCDIDKEDSCSEGKGKTVKCALEQDACSTTTKTEDGSVLLRKCDNREYYPEAGLNLSGCTKINVAKSEEEVMEIEICTCTQSLCNGEKSILKVTPSPHIVNPPKKVKPDIDEDLVQTNGEGPSIFDIDDSSESEDNNKGLKFPETLKCYICNSRLNDPCSETKDKISDCPPDSVCMTYRDKMDGSVVEKGCSGNVQARMTYGVMENGCNDTIPRAGYENEVACSCDTELCNNDDHGEDSVTEEHGSINVPSVLNTIITLIFLCLYCSL